MKTIYYDPNKKLMPQLANMVQEYKNMMAAHEHLGLATTVPVQTITLLDFSRQIISQCVRLSTR